jgi:hypothetical protein
MAMVLRNGVLVDEETGLEQPAAPAPVTTPAPSDSTLLPAPLKPDTGGITVPLLPESERPIAPAPTTIAPLAPTPTQSQIKTGETISTTMVPGFTPSKAVLAQQQEALAKEEGAATLLAEAATERAQAEAKAIAAQAKTLADTETARLKAETVRAEKEQKAREAIDSAMNQVKDYTVNPDKFFDNRGGFMGRLGAAFAVGLGAYASTMGGGPNYAMQIIDNAIGRDLEAQRAELAKRKDMVGETRGQLQDLRTRLGDERAAESMAKAQMLEIAEMRLKETLAGVANKQAQAQGQQLLAQVQAKKADYLANIEERAQNKVQVASQKQFVNTQSALNSMDEKGMDRAMKLSDQYESDPTVKAAREIRQQSKDFASHLRSNTPESAAALQYLMARMLSGPGVLTDNDLKNASVTRSVFDSISSKVNRGVVGDLTAQEKEAFARVQRKQLEKSQQMIAQAGRKWMNKSADFGVPANMVISDEEELQLATKGPKAQTAPTGAPRK